MGWDTMTTSQRESRRNPPEVYERVSIDIFHRNFVWMPMECNLWSFKRPQCYIVLPVSYVHFFRWYTACRPRPQFTNKKMGIRLRGDWCALSCPLRENGNALIGQSKGRSATPWKMKMAFWLLGRKQWKNRGVNRVYMNEGRYATSATRCEGKLTAHSGTVAERWDASSETIGLTG